MKNLKFLLVSLVILAGGTYLLRGVPDDQIPYPDIRSSDTVVSYSGRPIPYNEVLLAYRSWLDFKIIIYNDLNDVLSDEDFDSLDFEAIKKATGASRVIRNGHRYWVLDKIESDRKKIIRQIGGHDFLVPGFVTVPILDVFFRGPYKTMVVERDTIYTYLANRKVYRLINPDGKVFTMQAASRSVDENQTIDQLDQLGSKLQLPDGWQFRVDVLEADLILASGGKTEILQDEFQNTYQRNASE